MFLFIILSIHKSDPTNLCVLFVQNNRTNIKTSKDAMFVIELLNSLLKDSIISFSPMKGRFAWDPIRIELIETGDNVAELIASNIKSFPSMEQQLIHILSCFGIQTDDTLLDILERYRPGLMASIAAFCEKGILDRGMYCLIILLIVVFAL